MTPRSGVALRPHRFEGSICPIGRERMEIRMPYILVSSRALARMAAIIEVAPLEVTWFGTVYRNGHEFLIDEVFLPKQEVTPTATHDTGAGIGDIVDLLLERPNGEKLIEALRFWGHSHVNMEAFPSGQDDAQMGVYGEQGAPWYVRAIANKRGTLRFWIWDYRAGVIYNDVAWTVISDASERLIAHVREEYLQKVEEVDFIRHEKPRARRPIVSSGPKWGIPTRTEERPPREEATPHVAVMDSPLPAAPQFPLADEPPARQGPSRLRAVAEWLANSPIHLVVGIFRLAAWLLRAVVKPFRRRQPLPEAPVAATPPSPSPTPEPKATNGEQN